MSGGVPTSYYSSLNQLGAIQNGFRQASQAVYGNPYSQSNYNPLNGTQLQALAVQGTHAISAIPNEGIRAGEIVAYRIWRLAKGENYLKSITADTVWLPGETMEGEVKAHGVYCYKHPAYVEDAFTDAGFAVGGSIEIWGDIIEFEKGYRAQYARIKSLDLLLNKHQRFGNVWFVESKARKLLAQLQERYTPALVATK